MSRARTIELRNMETEELENRLTEVRQEQFNLRFQLVTGQLDNYARIGQVRRDVARIETILREREIAAAEAAEEAQAGHGADAEEPARAGAPAEEGRSE